MSKRVGDFFESLVIAVILLVLAFTFVEDLSILGGWSADTRRALILAGLFFDLFFTVEFLVRSALALRRNGFARYLYAERGWVDFVASVPLLLFHSGPQFLALLAGLGAVSVGGALNVLKIVKTIRIVRILRLLRILKVFRGVRYVHSPMAQRHIARIATLCVTVLVFWLSLITVVGETSGGTGAEAAFFARQRIVASVIDRAGGKAELEKGLAALAELEPSLLIVKAEGATVYSRHDNAFYAERFLQGDYGYAKGTWTEAFFDEQPYLQGLAQVNLTWFLAIVILVLALLFLYSPYFAATVTDPIRTMRRGLEERRFRTAVPIPAELSGDDVFRLARAYNEEFLPRKGRGPSDAEE